MIKREFRLSQLGLLVEIEEEEDEEGEEGDFCISLNGGGVDGWLSVEEFDEFVEALSAALYEIKVELAARSASGTYKADPDTYLPEAL